MFAARSSGGNWDAADEERSLAVLCQLLLSEIGAVTSPEQHRGLLVAVGRRMAASSKLADVSHLDNLAEHANRLWQSLNWGSAGFEMDDEGIDIVHRDLPVASNEHLANWEDILPAILEGAYSEWFEQIGGSAGTLHTRITRQVPGEVEIRHGL